MSVGITGNQLEPDVVTVLSQTVTLTDAQIKALATTPFQLVAAPGVGKIHHFLAAILRSDFEAGDYTNINAMDAYLVIGNSDFAEVSSYLENSVSVSVFTGFFANSGGAGNRARLATLMPHQRSISGAPTGLAMGGGSVVTANYVNKDIALVMYNGNGNLTGGHALNSLAVTVLYMIIDVA